MKAYNIAVILDDGIGREVTHEGIKILKTVSEKHFFGIKTEIGKESLHNSTGFERQSFRKKPHFRGFGEC